MEIETVTNQNNSQQRDASTSSLSVRGLEDYALVQRALQHDEQAAYAILLERYRDSVYNTILKMVNNRDDADDLTIEAFGKAFRRLDSYTPNFAFSTWLFKIAINNSIDFIRRKRMKIYSIDEQIDSSSKQNFSDMLRSGHNDPEESYMQEQRIKLMQKALKQLQPKYRLMIEMRYFEERSYQEIANDLDIPLGTVKAQLFRAKELLNELIKSQSTEQLF